MKFSIITCTFNSAKYLKKNIESIKSQTHIDYEHIFIDGFSDDGTVELIREYQKEHPEKVFLHQFEPQGISNAMNKGIENTTGDYLIHLHSDDSLFNRDVLKDVNFFLNENSYDWIYGKINTIEESGKEIGVFPTKKIFHGTNESLLSKYILKFYNYIPHQAVFIKKSVFDKYGYFNESITSAMDPEMWLNIRNKTGWTFIDRIISNYMIRTGAQSSSKAKKKENDNNFKAVQKKYLNPIELFVMNLINVILYFKNKNYR